MVKKEYVTPALEVVEMECANILAGSVDIGTGDDVEKDKTYDTQKFDGFKHTWE